jgi:hypothetical protein
LRHKNLPTFYDTSAICWCQFHGLSRFKGKNQGKSRVSRIFPPLLEILQGVKQVDQIFNFGLFDRFSKFIQTFTKNALSQKKNSKFI